MSNTPTDSDLARNFRAVLRDTRWMAVCNTGGDLLLESYLKAAMKLGFNKPDGTVFYDGQGTGKLGLMFHNLDPAKGAAYLALIEPRFFITDKYLYNDGECYTYTDLDVEVRGPSNNKFMTNCFVTTVCNDKDKLHTAVEKTYGDDLTLDRLHDMVIDRVDLDMEGAQQMVEHLMNNRIIVSYCVTIGGLTPISED